MKQSLTQWVEAYFYRPSTFQKIIAIVLLPISFLYCMIGSIRFHRIRPIRYKIPIVSVGNLTVGGSGKTPLIIELAKSFSKPAIILRGYGRQSSGMVVVKDRSILCDTIQSGDEAMLYAQQLSHAVVIVSESRERGIAEALSMGCQMIFLDDGYGKHAIEKLDIVIDVPTPTPFCLPSGPYREMIWRGKDACIVKEGITFHRSVRIVNPTSKMVLVTAIARPERLDPYLPEVIEKVYFKDHHFFTQGELQDILDRTQATSILVTQKDLVKISQFKFNFSVMELSVRVEDELITLVKDYVYAAKN